MNKPIPVKTPTTPNFIKVGETYIPICNFSDDELREIGKLWTEELLKKSKKQLSNK